MADNMKKVISLSAVILIIAAMCAFAACSDSQNKEEPLSTSTQTAEPTQIGIGEKHFEFEAVDADNNSAVFTVYTDEETVGDALEKLGIISGEEGDYGLYVKTVNGITADYDADGTYWAFYSEGEYSQTGVDKTPITDGAHYAFKIEK